MTQWRQQIEQAATDLNVVALFGQPIFEGDMYLACRNTGPHLLTAKTIFPRGRGGYIVPVENAYYFDIWECVKVVEQ